MIDAVGVDGGGGMSQGGQAVCCGYIPTPNFPPPNLVDTLYFFCTQDLLTVILFFMNDTVLNFLNKLREKRTTETLKRAGPHGLTPEAYQARENMKGPIGSRARDTQEFINNLEAKYKERIGKPKIIDPEGGYANSLALAEMAMLIGAEKALSIPSLNEGEDEKIQEINALNKKKYLESLMRAPSSDSSNDWYKELKREGARLEDQWINSAQNTLTSGGMESSQAGNIANRFVGDTDTGYGYEEGRSLLNKPMYEELNKIKMLDQLRQIYEHQQEITPFDSSKEEMKKKYMQQLSAGERYV